MKAMALVCLVAAGSVPAIPAAEGATIVYFDPLNGTDAPLTGTSPGERSGGAGTGVWTADNGGAFRADGRVLGDGHSGVFLPFTPEPGKIYTLTADIDTTGAGDQGLGWISLGFATLDGNGAFDAPSVDGYGTMIVREVRGPWGRAFAGVRDEGEPIIFSTTPGPQELKTVLDASDPDESNWTMEFFNADTSVGGPVTAANGSFANISHAGFTRWQGTTGLVKNFKLVAEPAP